MNLPASTIKGDREFSLAMSISWKGLLLRAVLFSALINFPYIIHLYTYGEYSTANFNDSDELLYLGTPYLVSQQRPDSAFYFEQDIHQSFAEIISFRPRLSTEIVIGLLGSTIGLSVIELGLVLDIICCFLSYLAFSCLFRQVTATAIAAELGAGLLLAAPWLSSKMQILAKPFPWIEHILSPHIGWFHCVPVVRGIQTQLSYPLFAFVIGLMLSSLLVGNKRVSRYLLLGFTNGLLVYTYFFGWAAATAIIFFLYCIFCVFEKQRLISLIAWGGAWAATSFPGLFATWSYGQKSFSAALPKEILSNYWYFSLEYFILLVVCCLLVWRFARTRKAFLQGALVISCLLAIFVLMNVPSLLSVNLLPYHFLTFYLLPMLTGALAASVFDFAWQRTSFRKAIIGVVVGLVVGLTVVKAKFTTNLSRLAEREPSTVEIITYVRKNILQKKVFAFMSYEREVEYDKKKIPWRGGPNAFTVLADKPILHQELSLMRNAVDSAKREMAIGWLFYNDLALRRNCPKKIQIAPRELFNAVWPSYWYYRKEICAAAEQLNYSPCQMLQEYRIDYIVWDSNMPDKKPPWFEDLTTFRWRSSTGYYELFEFSQQRAREQFCDEEKNLSD